MRGAPPDVSMKPPQGKKTKVIVNFRCDPDAKSFMDGFVGPKGKGPTISEVTDWMVGLGRQHYEALHKYTERLEEIARLEGCSEAEALERVAQLGLAAYDRDKKATKK